MNYSPDYYMRRRNEDCDCSQDTPPAMARENANNRGMGRMPRNMNVSPMAEAAKARCSFNRQANTREELDAFPPGMAYVPWQVWQDLYDPEEGLPIGTIFRELDYPWEVGRCKR